MFGQKYCLPETINSNHVDNATKINKRNEEFPTIFTSNQVCFKWNIDHGTAAGYANAQTQTLFVCPCQCHWNGCLENSRIAFICIKLLHARFRMLVKV